jgi:hypothetical protein
MAHKLGVLVLHGMGSPKTTYAAAMIKELSSRLRNLKASPQDICFEAAFVGNVLKAREEALWKRLSNNRLDFKFIRKFIIHNFGDAVAYQRLSTRGLDVYTQIHRVILRHLKSLRSNLRKGLPAGAPERPLVLLSHSLGSYMLSNYVWDIQKAVAGLSPNAGPIRQKYGGNDFLEMKTLAGMVTFGCNIPLFSLAYPKFEAITFPSPTLARYFPAGTPPAKITAAAQWLNFYDRDDVLGYPLRHLSPSYRATVSKDIQINVGGFLSGWNPKSHTEYWTDNDFTKPVARLLARLLKLL